MQAVPITIDVVSSNLIRARCTTLCDKVFQCLAAGRWYPLVSSTNKTDRHDITEILSKVALNTTKQTTNTFYLNENRDI
jgi:hypothetical protein